MPSPHTADNITKLVEAILVEWNILESKIHRILTDNGSNMVADFKNQQHSMHSDHDVCEAVGDIEEQQCEVKQMKKRIKQMKKRTITCLK